MKNVINVNLISGQNNSIVGNRKIIEDKGTSKNWISIKQGCQKSFLQTIFYFAKY